MENREWILLNSIIYRIYTTEDSQEMQKSFLERIYMLIPFDGAAFFLAGEQSGQPVVCGMEPAGKEDGESWSAGEGLYDGHSIVYRESEVSGTESFHGHRLSMVLGLGQRFLGWVEFYRTPGREDFQYRDVFLLDMVKEHLAYRLDEKRKEEIPQKHRSAQPEALPAGLTGRETEIIQCILGGMGNREIAERLVITENTVKKHILNIYRKMGIRSRIQLFQKMQEIEKE